MDKNENKFSLISASVFNCKGNDFDVKRINLSDDDLKKLENAVGAIEVLRIKELDRESLSTPNRYKITNDTEDYYQRNVMNNLMHKLKTDTNIATLQSFSELFDENQLLYSSIVYLFKAVDEENSEKPKKLEHTRLYVYQLKKNRILKNELNLFKKVKTHPIDGNDLMSIISIEQGFSLPIEISDAVSTFTEKQLSVDEKIVTVNVLNATKFDEIFDTLDTQKAYAEHVLKKFLKGDTTLSSDNLKVKLESGVTEENILSEVATDDQLLKAFSSFKGTTRSTIQNTSKKQISDMFDYLRGRIKIDADLLFTSDDIPTIDNGEIILTVRSVKIFTALLENKIIEKLLSQSIVIPYFE